MCIPTFAWIKGHSCIHRLNEAKDELQMPVPLGNHVQGESDRSVITMEPMGIRLQWGLPSVGEMGLALSDGILAFQFCVPHLLDVDTQRLSRGFLTGSAVLNPTLHHGTFLLPLEELI
jgi:hypothetical protein